MERSDRPRGAPDSDSNITYFPGNPDSPPVEEFFQPASDTKGHNVPASFRSPPGLMTRVSRILASGAVPYRTKGELLRHALVRHLHWLEGLIGDGVLEGSELTRYEAMRTTLAEEEYMAQFTEIIERASAVINTLKVRGRDARAAKVAYRLLNDAKEIQDPDWRAEYVKDLTLRFGDLIKAQPKASLRGFRSETE